jgi:hypothetical protein
LFHHQNNAFLFFDYQECTSDISFASTRGALSMSSKGTAVTLVRIQQLALERGPRTFVDPPESSSDHDDDEEVT